MTDLKSLDLQTPIGQLVIEGTEKHILRCYFPQEPVPNSKNPHFVLKEAKQQLQEYFSGKRKSFDLPVSMVGTAYYQKVWGALKNIPFGSTITYTDLAVRTGNINAVRSVARANAFNPIAIIVPCHRVVGSREKLTGYAWGIQRKSWLLNHEEALYQKTLF